MVEPTCKAGDPSLIPGLGRSPEKGMATHFSILSWQIPWTERPGRLQSMESQIVRHEFIEKQQHFNLLAIYFL